MQKNALTQWYMQYLSTANPILQSRDRGRIILKDVVYMTMGICTLILIRWEVETLMLEVFAWLVRNYLRIPSFLKLLYLAIIAIIKHWLNNHHADCSDNYRGEATSPITRMTYKCEDNVEFCRMHYWFRDSCKQTCGQCNKCMLISIFNKMYNIFLDIIFFDRICTCTTKP